MIVWRGLIEASYLEDARVGELLRQRGKTLEAIALPGRSLAVIPQHGLDRERLLRSLAGRREDGVRGVHQSRHFATSWPRRGHAVAIALPVDPHDPGLLGALAQEPGGRRGQPRTGRRLHRSRRLQVGRQALGPVRQALSQEHLFRQLPVRRRPGQLPPRPVRPRRRSRASNRECNLQGRRRRRSAQPQQVAGSLYPGPDLRRPPPARQGARILSPGRRSFQRRRRRNPRLYPQGLEGSRSVDHPAPGATGRRRSSSRRKPPARLPGDRRRRRRPARTRTRLESPESASTIATSPRSTSRFTRST